VTSDGYSLRFGLEAFVEPSTRNGRRFARLGAGAEVVGVSAITGEETVIVATEKARALLCPAEDVNYLEGTGRGLILIKLGKGDRVLGFVATPSKTEGLTVTTNRGAQKSITPSSYGVTSRAGRGRELLKNGTLTGIVRPEVEPPELLEGQRAEELVE
jgi:DNA gyrase subunit A